MATDVFDLDTHRSNAYGEGPVKFDLVKPQPLTPVTGSGDIYPSEEVLNPELSTKKAPPKEWELDVRALISSKKWLMNYGLKRNRLDLRNVMPLLGFKHSDEFDFSLKKPVSSRYGEGMFAKFTRSDGKTFNITCSKEKLKQIINRLVQAILLYKRRLDWLTSESRRIFGVIQEHCVCIVLDIKNLSPQQFDQYRVAFERVLKEQVAQLAKFNLIRSAEDMVMFKKELVPVTQESLQEATNWLWDLDRCAPFSKTATCEAVLRAQQDRNIEAIYLFTEGSAVDGSAELLRTKLGTDLATCRDMMMQGGPMPLHVVSYNCASAETTGFLKHLAQVTGGRFHAYAVVMELDSYEGIPPDPDTHRANIVLRRKTYGGVPNNAGVREDVILVFEELEEARNTLAQMQALMEELPDTKVVYERSETNPPTMVTPRSAPSTGSAPNTGRVIPGVVPRTEKKAAPPPMKPRSEQYMGSEEWLDRNGLRAKKLGFFDILAGVAFKHCDGVVDLKRQPQLEEEQTDAIVHPKLVNAKYCDKFAHVRWKDGKVVHVQVTPEVHRNYEKRVSVVMDSIQQRIDWLQQGSRELFGTVIEDQIYILIDTSGSMAPSIQFVKDKLFVLMQEQLRHKQKFNILSFNSTVTPWKDRCVEVNEKNLQNAWSWIKDLECEGSTNTLAALQFALADHCTQAIYMLSDGRPDQPPKSVLAQVQLQHSIPIHTISFNCSDKEANKFLCQLAKDTGGRYHYFSETGQDPDNPPPWESEDIRLLRREYETAEKNLEKVAQLRDECARLAWRKDTNSKCSRDHVISQTDRTSAVPALPPRELYRSERPKSARTSRPGAPSPPARPMTATGYRSRPGHWAGRSRTSSYPKSTRPTSARRPLVACHTRTSLLRTLSSSARFSPNEWLLPETRELLEKQVERETLRIDEEDKLLTKRASKKKKHMVDYDKMSSKMWLKKFGLVAKKLTILDALAPTMIPHEPKYVPILNKHVLSKVFDDVLPIAHASGERKQIRLVNPQAVDLHAYETRLEKAIETYRKRLNNIVWKALPENEKENFNSKDPISFADNKLALMQALDQCGWPVKEMDIIALEDEIAQGEKYMQMAKDLRIAAEKKGMSEPTESIDDNASVASSRSSRSSRSSKSNHSSKSSHSNRSHQSRASQEFEGLGDVVKTKSAPKHPTPKAAPNTHNKVRRVLDVLRGQSVIARCETDGFYYQGFVIKCTDSRHALIEFQGQGQARTPTRFTIPIGGAVARPVLRVGDYVLVRVKNLDSNQECFVPGIVQFCPMRAQDQARFYTSVLYNGQQATAMRNNLVKISKARYSFAVRFIADTAHEKEDSPKLEIIPTPRHETYKAKDSGVLSGSPSRSSSESRGSRSESESRSEASERSDDEDDNQSVERKQTKSKLSFTKEVLAEHQQKLEELQRNLQEQQEKQEHMQKKLQKTAKKLKKKQKKLGREQKRQKEELKNYEDLKELKEVKAEDLEKMLPESDSDHSHKRIADWVSDQKSDTKEAGEDVGEDVGEEDSEGDSSESDGEKEEDNVRSETKTPEILRLRRSLPEVAEGEEVLARWSEEGWYYRGTIKQNCGNGSYMVEDSVGDLERIYREDVITDTQDAGCVIKAKDAIVALHPHYAFSYAPGVVLELKPDMWVRVRLYDGVETDLPREEVYYIDPHKFEVDVAYIYKMEEKWVGQAVVAKNNDTGMYHLGSVKQRIGNSRRYIVEWSDGASCIVEATHMFGAFTKKHQLNIGDHVLAIADPVHLLYLPGTVIGPGSAEEHIRVKFCNGVKTDKADLVQCFWLSLAYYDDAVACYKTKNKK